MSSSSRSFLCDDKFDVVISELISRGWIRITAGAMSVPRECELIWTNLASVHFGSVFGRFVNHFRGSQHLSNKAYLTYHLRSCGLAHHMPTTWSSSFESLPQMLAMVVVGSLAAKVQSKLNFVDKRVEKGEGGRDDRFNVEFLKDVISALEMYLRGGVDKKEEDGGVAFHACMASIRALIIVWDALSKIDLGSTHVIDSYHNISSQLHQILPTCSDIIIDSAVDAMNKYSGEANLWILKPVGLSCGDKIEVVSGLLNVMQLVKKFQYKCIMQKYIEKPLLVRGGRKFDIRQWVLVTSVNPLEIYGADECYLRLSKLPYITTNESLSSSATHLCNNAIQKHEDSYEKHEDQDDVYPYMCESMMSQEEFCLWLQRRDLISSGHTNSKDIFSTVLLPQIRNISVAVIQSVQERLVRVGKGFEWLGLDLMVDANMKVSLIEVNVSPDVSQSTPVTTRLVKLCTKTLVDLIFEEGGSCSKSSPDALDSGKDTAERVGWSLWHRSDKTQSPAQLKEVEQQKEKKIPFGNGKNYGPRSLDVFERVDAIVEHYEAKVGDDSASSLPSLCDLAVSGKPSSTVFEPSLPTPNPTTSGDDSVKNEHSDDYDDDDDDEL